MFYRLCKVIVVDMKINNCLVKVGQFIPMQVMAKMSTFHQIKNELSQGFSSRFQLSQHGCKVQHVLPTSTPTQVS
jgi:hypothetical protein